MSRARGLGALCGLSLLTACDPPAGASSFGPLRVGGQLPSYAGSCSVTGRAIGPTTPPGGKLYVHVIDERLPAACLDDACGSDAKRVTGRGGHVIGGSDAKLARAFGVDARTRPERRLVVVSDGSSRITSIFVDRGIADLGAVDLDPPVP